jgi:hypothetical protein
MSATTKRAPGSAVTASEGETGTINEEGHRPIVNNVAPTTDRTPTRYADLTVGETTIDEIEWADTNLAHLPVVVICDETRNVEIWQGDDGAWYRRAGTIVASPHSRGRFRINLYRGADQSDLALFERLVAAAKAGRFTRFGWTPYDSNGATCYKLTWSFATEPNKERVNKWGEPFPTIYPCHEPKCSRTYHEGDRDDWFHVHEFTERDGYSITIERGEHEEQWAVEVYATDLRVGPDKLGGFVSDLQWAAAECRNINTLRPSIQAVAA